MITKPSQAPRPAVAQTAPVHTQARSVIHAAPVHSRASSVAQTAPIQSKAPPGTMTPPPRPKAPAPTAPRQPPATTSVDTKNKAEADLKAVADMLHLLKEKGHSPDATKEFLQMFRKLNDLKSLKSKNVRDGIVNASVYEGISKECKELMNDITSFQNRLEVDSEKAQKAKAAFKTGQAPGSKESEQQSPAVEGTRSSPKQSG